MSDLISRTDVETAIKEFNKKRIDRIPKDLDMDKHSDMCDTILKENVELLKAISEIPTAYDVEAVVEKLDKASYKADCLGATVKYLNFDDTVHIVRAGGKE